MKVGFIVDPIIEIYNIKHVKEEGALEYKRLYLNAVGGCERLEG